MSIDYQGAEQALIDKWVDTKLRMFTDFNAISVGLSDRVYNWLAPTGIAYPYIIFQAQSPPNVVRGVGDAEVMVDTMYIVKGVAQAKTFESLAPVASAIRTALTWPNGDLVIGGAIFTSRYEQVFSMVEAEGTTQYRHLGGTYRIQAQAS